jgi:aminoglycoside/choline kinase family phosphotransferase
VKLSDALLGQIQTFLSDTSLQSHWLAGDGSDRSYYRVKSAAGGKTFVVMMLSDVDTAKIRAGTYEWITVGNLLRSQGIAVPAALKPFPDHSALLIEDYGDLMLQDAVIDLISKSSFSEAMKLYRKPAEVMGTLTKIPLSKSREWGHRAFDLEKLTWELRFFVQKYVQAATSIQLNSAENDQLKDDIDNLCRFLSDAGKYFAHRDYHSRNIMVIDGGVGIIDFQDGRTGPITYDLVSLVFDSYVSFSHTQRIDLLDLCIDEMCLASGKDLRSEIALTLCPMLLQRQLKAIGSFGYLTIEKERGNYLKYVRPAVQTLVDFGVEDRRWPFISGELLRLIHETANAQSNLPRFKDSRN